MNLLCWWLYLQDLLDCLEALLPGLDLRPDSEPLFLVDMADHGVLDDHLLVELVHLRVDDAVAHCLNDPFFDVVLVNVEQLGDLCKRLLLLLSSFLADTANLYVLLLENGLFHRYLLLLKKLLHLADLALELQDVLLHVEVHHLEKLFRLLAKLLHRVEQKNLLEIDGLWTLDGIDDQSFRMLLPALVRLLVLAAGVDELESFHVDLERASAISGLLEGLSARNVQLIPLVLREFPILRKTGNCLDLLDHHGFELVVFAEEFDHRDEHSRLHRSLCSQHEVDVQ